jgi:DNA-binding LacI/PurR family transcriptional regulator
MLEHGHRRIGFIAPPRELPSAAPKYAGYERALAEAGVTLRAELIETTPDFAVESGHRSALRLLAWDDPPTAIVAASDSLAIGTIRAARELAVPIPEELALIGNDNIASASDTAPPLTTIMAPAAELGSRSIGMLEQLMAGEPLEHAASTLGTRLVVRQSCGCQPKH